MTIFVSMRRNQVVAFEQSVLRTLRALDEIPCKLLVACSGGVDSVVLLEVLFRLRNVLGLELMVAHVHHGPGNSKFRKKAWRHVKEICEQKGLIFVSNSPDGMTTEIEEPLSSEQSLREYRWKCLRDWQIRFNIDAVATAHHFHDLLETRMMRLVRGTGSVGLEAMQVLDGSATTLRPLIMVEKAQVVAYARARKVEHVEDPSNKKTDAFRNWMRRWLKELDRRQPNGTLNMARSLARLAEELGNVKKERALTDGGIDRKQYRGSIQSRRRSKLARYCYHIGLKNYTQGHIEELMKRLDVSQKHFTCFSVSGASHPSELRQVG